MAYRTDPDLEFLQYCDNELLDVLVHILTKDKDGSARWTEELTKKNSYKLHYPDHKKYWMDISEEIQKFGGNTIINSFRGTGVLYKEVLCDACDKLKVPYNKSSDTFRIEEALLFSVLDNALEKMSESEKQAILKELNVKHKFAGQTTSAIIMGVFKAGGFESYKILVMVANSIAKAILGRGLSLAANALLTRIASIATGPIGWTILTAWTIADIAGPAYRVTIPAVIQISIMRRLMIQKNIMEEDRDE